MPLRQTPEIQTLLRQPRHAKPRRLNEGTGHDQLWPSSLAELIRSGNTTQAVIDSFARIGVKYATAQEAGDTSSLININRHNFSPRIGLARQFTLGNRVVALGGGFGGYRFPLPARTFLDQRNKRLKLRINMDFFNVLNMPGTGLPNATNGIISRQNSTNAPRQLQGTLRLSW